ncbi:MAG TPA: sigma-70 family RNA polymerase sigma factor [Solirubrobacterales bacterium]
MSETLLAPASEAPREADIVFDELYRSSRDDVYSYAAGLLRDRTAAEDVTAAAFERAYRKRSRFDPRRGNPRAWLFGIARNAALDELRRRGRQAELAIDPIDLSSATVASASEESERRLAVGAALETLDPRERELIALKFFAGLSNAEIARVLGVSESNAGTKLHRTVAKLREACHGAA